MCSRSTSEAEEIDSIVEHYKRKISEALDSMDIESIRKLVDEIESVIPRE